MAELTVNKTSVLDAYKKASKDTRKALENIFGIQVNFNETIIDRVKFFEDACDELEYSTITPMCGQLPDKYHNSIKTFYMLQVIVEALNEGWVADWNDTDQRKHFPYFRLVNGELEYAGVAARHSYFVFGFAYSNDVSRLCYSTEELAEYAGKQFLGMYNDFILPE
jgi:hypothetical protein